MRFLPALLLAGCASFPPPSPPTLTFRVVGLDSSREQDAVVTQLRSIRSASEFGVSLDGGIVDLTLAPGGTVRLSDLRMCLAQSGFDLHIAEGEIELAGPVRVLLADGWVEWTERRIPAAARNVEWKAADIMK